MALQISDDNGVRTLTLDRPEVLNAFDEALYGETQRALGAAAADPEVAVVLLTSIPGAEIELRLFARGGRLSGWEGELEGSVVPPWDWCFEVGVAGVDELGVVAA